MAYERELDQPEDVRLFKPGPMQGQPVGAPQPAMPPLGQPQGAPQPFAPDPRGPSREEFDRVTGGGRWASDDELLGVGLNPKNYARTGHAYMPDYVPGAPAPSAGGGAAPSGLAKMAGGASARYGTGNIPGAENLSRGTLGTLEGFNTGAWDNAPEGYEANSIKNTFGKIASRYDVGQPGAVKALMADPDFQRFFPEAQIIDHPNGDLIDFGDGRPVDVIRAARAGGAGEAWQWGVDDGSGGGAAGGGAGMGGMPNLQSILAGQDPLTDIIKRIEDLQSGNTPDAEQQALLQMIRGGGGL